MVGLTAAEASVGKSKVNNHTKPWWDNTLTTTRKQHWEAYKQTVQSGIASDWQEYYKLRKQLHKEIDAKKIRQWQEFNDEINTNFRKDQAQFWQLAGRLCGKGTTKAGGVNVV